MVDAFLRIWAHNEVRLGMAITSLARWEMEPWKSLTLLVCEESLRYESFSRHKIVWLEAENFAQQSIRACEELSTTPIWASCDDDALIYGPEFAIRGLAIMEGSPSWGFVCSRPTNEGSGAIRDGVDPIVEAHAVGGPGFVRRGILNDFPPIPIHYYDGHMHKQCIDAGFKQGYFRDLEYLHLGARYSFASPAHCIGY